MNFQRLTKLYDRLTPPERLPLLIAALIRGDSVEQARLMDSAPLQAFQVADYHGLAQAFWRAADFQIMGLLNLAAHFWRCLSQWLQLDSGAESTAAADQGPDAKAGTQQAAAAEAAGLACYHAARFVAHLDGWKQFCLAMHMDPEVVLNFMPGRDTIERTERQARQVAFSPEEAAQFLRSLTMAVKGNDSLERQPLKLETAEELANGWCEIVDQAARKW
jgi:hypothetical protein